MELDLPTGDFKGFIFDCDGTLVDSMPLHFVAWQIGLKAASAHTRLSEDLFFELAGLSIRDVVARLNEIYDDSIDYRIVHRAKESYFQENLYRIGPIAPVVALLEDYHREGFPIAVASGSQRDTVHRLLDQVGVSAKVSVVVTPEDVAAGKPAPDMFLLAAERIGVAPGDCLVFEDGASGIEAARRAGMTSVLIPSRFPDPEAVDPV